MRRVLALLATLLLGAAVASAGALPAAAGYAPGGSTVGCVGSTSAPTFGGRCVVVEGPSAPTRPAQDHPWLSGEPEVPPACSPYQVTQWAPASADGVGGPDGSIGTVDGQRIPMVYSDPRTDWGWVFTVECQPGLIRFTGLATAPREPSPCSAATVAAECLPGFDAQRFLEAVEGEVPAETVSASPAALGVVGVPVLAGITPLPVTEYAVVDLTEPDRGDGDPGEIIHVVWVVEAVPETVSWSWPDGTSSQAARWIPQVYVVSALIRAQLIYQVSAEGFWSDGVTVYDLPEVAIGTIPISATLGYSVEQVQPGLG